MGVKNHYNIGEGQLTPTLVGGRNLRVFVSPLRGTAETLVSTVPERKEKALPPLKNEGLRAEK